MISKKISHDVQNASWIRAMFEEGARLRQIHGADKVFDFSLGNPDYEPPEAVLEELKKLAATPGIHKYTSNAGYPDVRENIAIQLNQETGLPFTLDHVIMTCGAAGGLNVVLKTILNPAEEVILLAPYFVEYGFYTQNHNGQPVVVSTGPDFMPDLNAIERAITSNTKAIILNSPNNPSGVIYPDYVLEDLSRLLVKKEKELGITILVISDEPYGKLVYDNAQVPNLMNFFKNCAIVNSFSKSLALPGERIGYIALSPQIECLPALVEGLVFSNRTLGFVNAPSLFQKLVAACLDQVPDVTEYKKRRDLLYNHLTGLGFSCVKPQGAFYLFPKSPIPDDIEFVKHALKYNLLLVPGRGFACPGYFRIAYCVDEKTIRNSFSAFELLAADYFK